MFTDRQHNVCQFSFQSKFRSAEKLSFSFVDLLTSYNSVLTFICCRMDADTNTYDEMMPNVQLKDGLDIQKLQLGEGQTFEIGEDDDVPDGNVSF